MNDDERPVPAESCPLCAELREVAAALYDALLELLCTVSPQDVERSGAVEQAERARSAYLRYVTRRLAIVRVQKQAERRDTECCPLCGEDVAPAEVRLDSGVPWTRAHHAHALCALENLAARVTELERALERVAGPRWWER